MSILLYINAGGERKGKMAAYEKSIVSGDNFRSSGQLPVFRKFSLSFFYVLGWLDLLRVNLILRSFFYVATYLFLANSIFCGFNFFLSDEIPATRLILFFNYYKSFFWLNKIIFFFTCMLL